jgi:glycosyltransferase involved in cell wall biosynthesis
MKFLFFLTSLELGGAERQAILLAEHLQSEGHDVKVWGLGKPGKASSLCDEKKIVWESKRFWLEGNIFKEANGLFEMIRDIKKFSPDIIIPYCTTPSLLCALSWRFTRTRVCLWGERDIGLSRGFHKEYPFAIKLSTCVVTNSREGESFIKKEFGYNLDVRVICNGVYTSPAKETKEIWRKKLGAGETSFIACMVANIHRIKNHPLLIEAWNKALKSSVIPSDSLLVLAGHEYEAENVKCQVANYGIQDNVKFLGQVDDIPGLLSAVDMGVLTSFSESQPNAILEYMYAGLPVIASDLPSIRDILQDTDSCFFRKDSVDDLVTAFQQMASADRRHNAGLHNAKICRQKYSPERMFADYEALFSELLANQRSKIPLNIRINIILWFPKYIVLNFYPVKLLNWIWNRIRADGFAATIKYYFNKLNHKNYCI